MKTSWWLNWGALPDRLIWARLQTATDDSAIVLDMDGAYHQFQNEQSAILWLNEDEYSLLAHLIDEGEVGPDMSPPTAVTDRELVLLMCVQFRKQDQNSTLDPGHRAP